MKRYKVTIKNDGTVKAEAFGFAGQGCLEATAFLDDLFGEPKREMKGEFYQSENERLCNTEWCG